MQLNETAAQRIRDSGITGENLASVLAAMVEGVNVMGAAASQIVLDYQGPDDQAANGDLFPVIILALRESTGAESGEVFQRAEQVFPGSVQAQNPAVG